MHDDESCSSCEEEVRFIGDFLNGNLTAASRRAFESHLSACPDCAAFLHTYEKTIEITRSFLRLQTTQVRPPRAGLAAR
jgi:anti-sigma factor RsiW